MSRSIPELAMEYGRAWAERDPDAIAALHTDDSIFHLHDITPSAVGKAEVRRLAAALLEDSPDVQFGPRRVNLGTDHFVTEYLMSGTVEGSRFAVEGADVFTIRDGLVARKDTYVDWLVYQRQLGLDPVGRLAALLAKRPA